MTFNKVVFDNALLKKMISYEFECAWEIYSYEISTIL